MPSLAGRWSVSYRWLWISSYIADPLPLSLWTDTVNEDASPKYSSDSGSARPAIQHQLDEWSSLIGWIQLLSSLPPPFLFVWFACEFNTARIYLEGTSCGIVLILGHGCIPDWVTSAALGGWIHSGGSLRSPRLPARIDVHPRNWRRINCLLTDDILLLLLLV